MRKTGIIAIGVAVALAPAGYAVAAGDAGTVATYTGCLKNGKLESLAVGDAPLAPCEAAQPPVRLSGGDITSATAGPGLTGGGDTGAVTLALDPSTVQSRVKGDCERDRFGPIDASIRAIQADGSVSCNPDDIGPGTDVFAGYRDDLLWLPVNSSHSPVPIARLPIDPGRYLATATLDLQGGPITRIFATCELRAENDFDRTTLSLEGQYNASGQHNSRITLQVAHQFSQPGELVIACAATSIGSATFLKIAATRVTGLSNTPLQTASP